MKNVPPVVIVRKKRPASSPAAASPPTVPRKARGQTPQQQYTAPVPSVKKPPVKELRATVPVPPPSTTVSQAVPNQPNAKQRQIHAQQVLLDLFRKRWPQLFPEDIRQIKPFALGIHQALIDALPDTKPYLIRYVLSVYQREGKGAYWRAILKGGLRYNLDGTPNGEVTARDQEYAKEQLAAIAAWHKAKRAGRPCNTVPPEETGNAPASTDAE